MPIKPQKMPIVNAPVTLNVMIRSIDIVILSGLGGNKRYALPIITKYNNTGITMFSFDLEGLLIFFTSFFVYRRAGAKLLNPEMAINPTYKLSL